MSLGPVSRGHAVLMATLCLTFSVAARADETDRAGAAAASDARPSPQPAGPLLVWMDAHGSSFDQAGLKTSLAEELKREVAFTDDSATAAVQIRLDGAGHAAVHYATPGGEQLLRTVDLPPDPKRAVQVVSWLTVNLVRDEAAELLDELRARRKEESETRAAAELVAADQAAADKAVADKVAADKAAADKAAADKAASDQAARDKADKAAKRPPDLLRDPLRSVDAALATPLSVLSDSSKRLLHLQVALGYGDVGGIDGIAASFGVVRVRRDLQGIGLGLGAVMVGGNARGILVGGGYSQLEGNLEGLQFGGGAALQRGQSVRGVVVAGGGALAGNVEGAVVGGAFATAKSLRGLAVAAGATVIRGPSEGLLLAGAVNSATQHQGLELSAGVNAARELEGAAIAPVNVHRRVKGLQIGVVNVADEVDGAAIGVLSFSKNGRVQPMLWGSNDGSMHVAIKSVAGYVFTEFGSGIDLSDDEFSYDGGIGAHLRLGKIFFLEPSVHYSATHKTADAAGDPDQHQLHYLAQLGLRVADKLDLLAAAGLRHTVAGPSGAGAAPEVRAGIAFF